MIRMSSISLRFLALTASVALSVSVCPVDAQDNHFAARFEVASVRSLLPDQAESLAEMRDMLRGSVAPRKTAIPVFSGLRVDMNGISIRDLIAIGYEQDPARIAGPQLLAARYVIHAIMPSGGTRRQLAGMVRELLAERFHLEAHRESLEERGFALVVGKQPAKLAEPEDLDRTLCEPWVDDPTFPGAQTCSGIRTKDGKQVLITFKSDSPYGPWQSWGNNNTYNTEFFRINMQQVADYLSAKFSSNGYGPDRFIPVTDNTGIQGFWHVMFGNTIASPLIVTLNPTADAAVDSFSGALDKIGLKLRGATVSVDRLVVTHFDLRPTEN